jgi:general nucleoside transport system ATP-binding protein
MSEAHQKAQPPTRAVQCRGVVKYFGDCYANNGVNLEVNFGEVHAIVGENGAGKSTLMKMLAGLYAPDEGEIWLRGERLQTFTPKLAIQKGVGMVHQHFMLVESFTVAENIILGQEQRGLWLEQKEAAAKIKQLASQFGIQIDPSQKVEALSVGERQRVEIIKVLYRGAEIFIFDEPTAVLSPPEVAQFLETLRALAAANKAVLLITHKLDEVLAVASKITVLRQGKSVAALETKDTNAADIARAMVGREVRLVGERRAQGHVDPTAKAVLQIEGLHAKNNLGIMALQNVSLRVASGEVVGVAGVEGNGQHELILSLCGLHPIESGKILLHGKELHGLPPKARNLAGLAHVPEDRHQRGLVLDMSVAENLILGKEEGFSSGVGVLFSDKIKENAAHQMKEFDIRPAEQEVLARRLSGGNQQKVVIARELSKRFSLLIASQPTRGVDVGAIEFIHERLLAARSEGKAILLLSSELDEILALSDRVLVLYRGVIVGETRAADATKAQLGAWMAGIQ